MAVQEKKGRKPPSTRTIKNNVINHEQVKLKAKDKKTQAFYNKQDKMSILNQQLNLQEDYCNGCPVRGVTTSNKYTYCLRVCPVGEQMTMIGNAYEDIRNEERKTRTPNEELIREIKSKKGVK